MSGVDEQDIIPCKCGHFAYWVIHNDIGVIGYLNPDIWVKKSHARAVNRTERSRMLSKEDFVNSVISFRCVICAEKINKGCSTFDSLCCSITARWDVHNVRDR